MTYAREAASGGADGNGKHPWARLCLPRNLHSLGGLEQETALHGVINKTTLLQAAQTCRHLAARRSTPHALAASCTPRALCRLTPACFSHSVSLHA